MNEEQLLERREKATHKHVVTGTLFQLSRPDDDFPDNAWWLNEASGMWQVSEFSNGEVKFGERFEAVSNVRKLKGVL